MPVRKAVAVWEGPFPQGNGKMKVESGAFSGRYSFGTRFENEPGTNPEELLGAAHAGCFSMALAGELTRSGNVPRSIETVARVELQRTDGAFRIQRIELSTEADVPNFNEEDLRQVAEKAKSTCLVSQALASVEITLKARLVQHLGDSDVARQSRGELRGGI